MQLNPRYDSSPVIVLDSPPGAIAEPVVRQRRRLLDTVRSFSAEQWAHPSRCAHWSTRDVIAHLDTTNGFWSLAVAAGQRGEPTRMLATFDPVTSPDQLVASTRELGNDEVFAQFEASTNRLLTLIDTLDDEAWALPAEAPPGHLAISAVLHHALWDSWIHERDILIPLTATPNVEADELAACLRYGAALGPALAVNNGDTTHGCFTVATTDPEIAFEVTIGDQVQVHTMPSDGARASGRTPDLELTGPAVDLLEAFSVRAPFPQVRDDQTWLLTGLVQTFTA